MIQKMQGFKHNEPECHIASTESEEVQESNFFITVR